MKKFVLQFVALVIGLFAALFIFIKNPDISGLPFVPEQPVIKQVQIKDAVLKVEIADTPNKRSKGLGGRESIASDEGMLFVFPEIKQHSFWMKGMNFPLDFIWIRGESVVDVFYNIPAPEPGQADNTLPIFKSGQSVDKVLELQSGTAQRLNIKVGDNIKIL